LAQIVYIANSTSRNNDADADRDLLLRKRNAAFEKCSMASS